MIGAAHSTTLAAALSVLGCLVGCGEVNRPIGRLSSASGEASQCESLGQCAGDPLAGAMALTGEETEWVATAPDACSEVVASAPPAACQGLVLKKNGTGTLQVDSATAPVRSVSLRLTPTEYRLNLVRHAQRQVTFSAACRAAQEVSPSCPALGRLLGAAVAARASIDDLRCADDGDGGCRCDYELLYITRSLGTWDTNQGTLTFRGGLLDPATPDSTDYCQAGNTLELTDQTELGLFGSTGVKTLLLHPPTCSDGVMDLGETGIDCGGRCGPCGTCSDGIQNGDEQGVDCGGSCFNDFCGCFNGTQDAWEEGVDCGGPCALLCSCTNGVGDENEDGVDCGGDCQRRFSDSTAIACP